MKKTKAAYQDSISEREKKNQKIAYQAAVEGIVLLENDGTLPIIAGKIALYGNGAKRTTKGGSGSGEVNVRHEVNILEGLELAGFQVTTKSWIDRYEEKWGSVK